MVGSRISVFQLSHILLAKQYMFLKSVNIEQFTDVFRVEFEKLEHARRAKKFSDAKNFYGGK